VNKSCVLVCQTAEGTVKTLSVKHLNQTEILTSPHALKFTHMNEHTYSYPCCQIFEMSLFCNPHVSVHVGLDTGRLSKQAGFRKKAIANRVRYT